MATFTDIRTARKRHVPGTSTGGCEVCRKAIEPGQRYERFSATPRDDMWNCDGWTHLKAHHPYGGCASRAGTRARPVLTARTPDHPNDGEPQMPRETPQDRVSRPHTVSPVSL